MPQASPIAQGNCSGLTTSPAVPVSHKRRKQSASAGGAGPPAQASQQVKGSMKATSNNSKKQTPTGSGKKPNKKTCNLAGPLPTEGIQDSLTRGQSANGSANGLQAMDPYSMSVPTSVAHASADQPSVPKVDGRTIRQVRPDRPPISMATHVMAENADLKTKIDELDFYSSKKRRAYKSLQKRYLESCSNKQQGATDLTPLEHQLLDKQSECDELNEFLDIMMGDLTEQQAESAVVQRAEQQLAHAQKSFVELERDAATLRSQLASNRTSQAELMSTVARLQSAAKVTQQERDSERQCVSAVRQELKVAQVERESQTQCVAAMKEEFEIARQAWTEQVQMLRAELKAAQQCQQLHQPDCTAQQQSLQQMADTVSALQHTCNEQAAELSTAQPLVLELFTDLVIAQNAESASRAKLAEIEQEHRSDVDRLMSEQQTRIQAERELFFTRREVKQANQLLACIDEAAGQTDVSFAALQQAREVLGSLFLLEQPSNDQQTGTQQCPHLQLNVHLLRKVSEQLFGLSTDLSDEHESALEELKACQAALTQSQQDLADTRQELAGAKQCHTALQDAFAEQQRRAEFARQELADTEAEASKTQEWMHELSELCQHQTKQLGDLGTALEEVRHRLLTEAHAHSISQDELSALQQLHQLTQHAWAAELQTHTECLAQVCDDCVASQDAHAAQLSTAEQQQVSLQQQVVELTASHATALAQVKEQQSLVMSHKALADRQANQLTKLEAKLKKKQAVGKATCADKSAVVTSVVAKANSIADLQAKLELADRDKAALQAQLDMAVQQMQAQSKPQQSLPKGDDLQQNETSQDQQLIVADAEDSQCSRNNTDPRRCTRQQLAQEQEPCQADKNKVAKGKKAQGETRANGKQARVKKAAPAQPIAAAGKLEDQLVGPSQKQTKKAVEGGASRKSARLQGEKTQQQSSKPDSNSHAPKRCTRSMQKIDVGAALHVRHPPVEQTGVTVAEKAPGLGEVDGIKPEVGEVNGGRPDVPREGGNKDGRLKRSRPAGLNKPAIGASGTKRRKVGVAAAATSPPTDPAIASFIAHRLRSRS